MSLRKENLQMWTPRTFCEELLDREKQQTGFLWRIETESENIGGGGGFLQPRVSSYP